MAVEPTKRRLHLRVDGRVQGVGFRATTAHLAATFPVTGYVMNQFDGSVEILAEGSDADLTAFWTALRRSHVYRFVTSEQPCWSEARGTWTDFSIRYA